MGVDYIYNFMNNPRMNFILIFEVSRSKPRFEPNAILNLVLLKDMIWYDEEIGIENLEVFPSIKYI